MPLLDNTFAAYVNLDKRIDRRDRMEKSLEKAGILAVRQRGMLPEEYTESPARIQAMWNRPQKGAIGCHFSQVQVMKQAKELGKHALVMEDDLVFCSDFQERLRQIEEFMGSFEWDIFWLGATFHVNPPYWHVSKARGCQMIGRDACRASPNFPRFIRTFGCFCTYAYIVNRDSIRRVLDQMEPLLPQSIGIDHMMIMLQPKLWTYCYVPGLIKQYDHISDIGVNTNGAPAVTTFSNFAKLNGTVENSAYWWQDKASDFDPDKFDWHEAK
jgi:GR25 family glycosyltransferase involved in LPS biosynthesis